MGMDDGNFGLFGGGGNPFAAPPPPPLQQVVSAPAPAMQSYMPPPPPAPAPSGSGFSFGQPTTEAVSAAPVIGSGGSGFTGMTPYVPPVAATGGATSGSFGLPAGDWIRQILANPGDSGISAGYMAGDSSVANGGQQMNTIPFANTGNYKRTINGQTYNITPINGNTGSGASNQPLEYRVYKDDPNGGFNGIFGDGHREVFNGQTYDSYDAQGNFLGTDKWSGLTPGTSVGYGLLSTVGAAFAAAAAGAAAGGGAAAGEGAGAGTGGIWGQAGEVGAGLGGSEGLAAAGAGGGLVGDTTAAGYGGLDAASTASMGGGSSVLGGSTLEQAAAAAGAAGSAGGAASGAGAGTGGATAGASSGLGSISIPGIGNVSIGQLGSLISTLGQLGGGSGGSGGGLNLGNLGSLIGGGVDASQQGKAAEAMKAWMDGQQAKVDNLYSPGSPEFNSLWDEMSRKDAAAGRNSQYGPRSVDLAARVAQIKAENTSRMTTGLAPAYAAALNQNASKYSGLLAALGQNSGGTTNLTSLLGSMFGGGTTDLGGGITMGADGSINSSSGLSTNSTMSNDDIWNMINGGDTNSNWWD